MSKNTESPSGTPPGMEKIKDQDEAKLYKLKWDQFKKDREEIDNHKKKTLEKLKEWEGDLRKKWETNVPTIKFYPRDEFERSDITDYEVPYKKLKAKWNEIGCKEPINWEEAAKVCEEEIGELRRVWEKKHGGTEYRDGKLKTPIKFDNWFPVPDKLIIATNVDSPKAKKKKFDGMMEGVAIGGLVGILALIILSISCASSDFCGTETITTSTIDVDGKTTTQTETRPLNMPQSILESQFVMVLISVVIAPVFAKMLKDKYDIQITESQISMIMTDALNSVKMYVKEANTLRDKNGKIGEVDQRTLRNLAFTSLESNYELPKYKDMISNVGSQIFEKAIEKAVEEDKMKRFPLEKAQVQEMISQAIDATPQIIKWKDLNPEMKEAFLDGHVRTLLKNVGVEGWGYGILENMLDSESNKRVLAAAVADKNKLLSNLDPKDENLKLLSTVLSAVSDSIAKPPKEK